MRFGVDGGVGSGWGRGWGVGVGGQGYGLRVIRGNVGRISVCDEMIE